MALIQHGSFPLPAKRGEGGERRRRREPGEGQMFASRKCLSCGARLLPRPSLRSGHIPPASGGEGTSREAVRVSRSKLPAHTGVSGKRRAGAERARIGQAEKRNLRGVEER